ncbi:MAG: hypothetical protein A2Z25_23475 [Planctomycetes bacterium RBG_16_55_9]|nr:MAG: hypothetical protein A2Z25_23475 [Planctomycetes bacterium RBG_16_55_9]
MLYVTGYVFDIKKYAIHDGPGIRTTVFFKGCPLRCRWCHNPESWRQSPQPGFRRSRCRMCGRCAEACQEQAITSTDNGPVTDVNLCKLCGQCVSACAWGAREIIGQQMTVEQVMREVEKDVIFYDQSGGGVTFSGGEPLMQPQFLLALLNQCREKDIHTAVDTTCYAEPEILQKVAAQADLFLCDLKHIDTAAHKRFTGVDNDRILYNIKGLCDAGKKVIIRIPIVPGFNDDPANIEGTSRFVASLAGVVEIGLLPYNRGGLEKSARLTTGLDLMESEVPSDDKMTQIAAAFRNRGFEVKIGG